MTALRGAVDQHRQVEFLGDVGGFGDQHRVDRQGARRRSGRWSSWCRASPWRTRGPGPGSCASLTPPALPRPPAWICALTTQRSPPMALAASTASSGYGRRWPGGHGDAVIGEQLLGLVFVEVHAATLWGGGGGGIARPPLQRRVSIVGWLSRLKALRLRRCSRAFRPAETRPINGSMADPHRKSRPTSAPRTVFLHAVPDARGRPAGPGGLQPGRRLMLEIRSRGAAEHRGACTGGRRIPAAASHRSEIPAPRRPPSAWAWTSWWWPAPGRHVRRPGRHRAAAAVQRRRRRPDPAAAAGLGFATRRGVVLGESLYRRTSG